MSRTVSHFHSISHVYLPAISCRFLLVSLNIDAILGEVTIRSRRRKLEQMTLGNGLSDAYTATLARLKAQKGEKSVLGLKALMWVVYSERPLRSQELCHALGVDIGSPDLDAENIPALRTLVSSCLGLVTVEASSSTVRLVHFTLQEHLSSDPTLFHSPHSTIAEVCLTYLNFRCIRDLSPTLYSAPETAPLLEYASVYWGGHTRRGMTENIKMLALRLLDGFDEHISAQILLLHSNRCSSGGPYFDCMEGPRGFTGLHGVAFLGIAGIVSTVLEMKEWDVNASDCIGITALMWAAARGHEEVVMIFLGREDVNPDQADTKYGRTPLLWAVERGHEGMVKMLLEREGVNPDQADTKYGRTPLSWAAEEGHEGMVKMLLEREGVNPDQADTEYGWTPLWWAAAEGHEGIVKMLLEREGVNPNQPLPSRGRGLTPLSWAAVKGHEGIAKMLLEREGVNPGRADTKYGRTPLWWAAVKGHEGIVKMLLEQEGVNPDQADARYGRTPLSWAAEKGHAGIVKMLLEREGVSPDQADTKYGRTPLLRAAKGGHEGIVKMLLERDGVNPGKADTKYGQTPLRWAAANGHEGIVKMLLEREDVNPDQADTKYGRTPLLWAAKRGHEGIVKMLLEREGVNPGQADTEYGRTPLWWAAVKGHEGIVKMLLEQEGVNPDQPDARYGRTPLSWAAEKGHAGIVKMLLEREGVSPDQADTKDRRTPLMRVAKSRNEGIVKMPLERGDVNPFKRRRLNGEMSNRNVDTKTKPQDFRPQKTLIANAKLRAGSSSFNCSPAHSRLANSNRSTYQPDQSPPILPRATTHVHALVRMPPPPLQTPGLTNKDKLPLSIASAHHPTSAHPTLSLLYSFPAFIPADASIQNSSAFLDPKLFPKSQSIHKASIPEATNKRVSRNHLNKKGTIMRACRVASHDFQQILTGPTPMGWLREGMRGP